MEGETEEEELQRVKAKLKKLQAHLLEREKVHNREIKVLADRIDTLTLSLKEQDDKVQGVQDQDGKLVQIKEERDQLQLRAETAEESLLELENVMVLLKEDYEQRKEDRNRAMQERIQEMEARQVAYEERIAELEGERKEVLYRQAQQEEELAIRDEEIATISGRVEQLQQAIRTRFQDMQAGESVDKQLITSLVVGLVTKRSKRKDILVLISRILEMSEEDKQLIGLLPTPVDKSKQSLSDLWVQFLLKETEQAH